MAREPAYIIAANILRYERLLADPKTPPQMRTMLAQLLEEARQSLNRPEVGRREPIAC